MITREQYLDALELINLYHRQFEVKDIKEVESRVLIREWIDTLYIPTRVYNVLRESINYHSADFQFKYVDDITAKKFLYMRNAGRTGWKQLEKILIREGFINRENIDLKTNTV